jgi:hypothetical protein
MTMTDPIPPDGGEQPARLVSEEQRDASVLGLLCADGPWPWSLEEIARELQDRIGAEDAVARLVGAGLVHRLVDLVFPTRAARRASELGAGDA